MTKMEKMTIMVAALLLGSVSMALAESNPAPRPQVVNTLAATLRNIADNNDDLKSCQGPAG